MKISNLFNLVKDNYIRYKKIGSGDILVYTMGKVGSSAIYDGLEYCYQTHNLDYEIPSKYFSTRFTPYLRRYIFEFLRWKIFFRKASKLLLQCKLSNKKIKIITVVRDPVGRNLSSFFQNLDNSQINDKTKLSLEFFAFVNHFLPLYWFDIEMKKNIGIDVYDYTFDKNKGWSVIHEKNYEIMIIQLEKLSGMESHIREFVGDSNFFMKKKSKGANVSNEKWYADLYDTLKETVVFPKCYLDIMYSSMYVKHFYSVSQIDSMRKKWRTFINEDG